MLVRTKRDYYRRWLDNEFGNRLQCWNSWEEVPDTFIGRIGIRNRVAGSPFCCYDLTIDQVPGMIQEFLSRGCLYSDMTFGEAAPDQNITFQCEVIRSTDFYSMHYSLHKSQMRTALRLAGQYAEGLLAQQLMKHFCDYDSYEHIMALFERYQNHALEFSCYSKFVGNVPRRNTLIWEVRHY